MTPCPITRASCSVGEGYSGGQAFVDSEVNGTWHTALAVPGLTAFSHGLGSAPGSLSCGVPGKCVMGGFYEIPPLSQQNQQMQGFVVARQ
jgi:hypothetical protein